MKSVRETIEAYKEQRERKKRERIERLKNNIEFLESELESVQTPFSLTNASLAVLSERYHVYQEKREFLSRQLETMRDVMPKTKFDQLVMVIIEFFFGVWFLAFFTYRILGEESFSEVVPTFGLDVNPLIFAMVIEGVTVVMVSLFFSMLNKRGFSKEKRAWYGKWLIGVLIAWVAAFLSFMYLYNL
jgi:hypothetical protein